MLANNESDVRTFFIVWIHCHVIAGVVPYSGTFRIERVSSNGNLQGYTIRYGNYLLAFLTKDTSTRKVCQSENK